VRLTFLGQSGFIIEDGQRIVIDPFLGPLEDDAERARFPRLVEPPVAATDLAPPDLVLVSHHHGDHCHVATLAAIARRAPACRFVVTPSSRDLLLAAGLEPERLVVPDLPGWVAGLGARVFVAPAAHYEFSYRPDVMFDFFGFVVETSAGRVYAAGDTIRFNGLGELVRSLNAAVALLPVNGRDAAREQRGIVGNLSAEESAELARRCAFPWVVPCHVGMFADNTADMGAVSRVFGRDCPGSRVWVPSLGGSREF
jgi:L-ascorbate 6-phosphate lactonase